jgi:hypothetical protein
MSDQQSQQGNQPEPQQHDGQAIIRPRPPWPIMQLIYVIIRLTYNAVMDHYAPLYLRTPYHTSSLSGADWVGELLAGHPNRIRNELGVYRGTFLVLTEIMKQAGLQSSRHVSIEEQLSIFLYTAVTGLTSIHVGERFQRSTSTITK